MSPDERRLLEVGRIGRPHGLRGEVLVHLITERTERLAPGSVLETARGALTVRRSSAHQDRWIVAFEEIPDRTAAESWRNVVLLAEPVDDPGALWVHELIGARVVTPDGADHGQVVSVEANPASDLLVLDSGALVPVRFVEAAEPGRIVVDPPAGLLEL